MCQSERPAWSAAIDPPSLICAGSPGEEGKRRAAVTDPHVTTLSRPSLRSGNKPPPTRDLISPASQLATDTSPDKPRLSAGSNALMSACR